MKYLRISIRLLLIAIHLLIGFVLCLLIIQKKPNSWFRIYITPWWMRTVTSIVGLRIKVHGHSTPNPAYLVANHISWLDIVVIGGIQPVSFLSKYEVLKWPFIGYLARCGGTLSIKRGSGVSSAMQQLISCMQQGMSTVVFPEGTTSSGDAVHRFYPRLFAAAIDSQAIVQPLAITYPALTSSGITNPVVPLKRSPHFLSSALAIMGQPYINVVVRYAEPFPATDTRKLVAQQAQEAVAKEFELAYEQRQTR